MPQNPPGPHRSLPNQRLPPARRLPDSPLRRRRCERRWQLPPIRPRSDRANSRPPKSQPRFRRKKWIQPIRWQNRRRSNRHASLPPQFSQNRCRDLQQMKRNARTVLRWWRLKHENASVASPSSWAHRKWMESGLAKKIVHCSTCSSRVAIVNHRDLFPTSARHAQSGCATTLLATNTFASIRHQCLVQAATPPAAATRYRLQHLPI